MGLWGREGEGLGLWGREGSRLGLWGREGDRLGVHLRGLEVVLQHLLLLGYQVLSFSFSLLLEALLILHLVHVELLQALPLQALLVHQRLCLLLPQQSKLLLHLHAGQDGLLHLLLPNPLQVVSAHAVQRGPCFLCLTNLMQQQFLVSCENGEGLMRRTSSQHSYLSFAGVRPPA